MSLSFPAAVFSTSAFLPAGGPRHTAKLDSTFYTRQKGVKSNFVFIYWFITQRYLGSNVFRQWVWPTSTVNSNINPKNVLNLCVFGNANTMTLWMFGEPLTFSCCASSRSKVYLILTNISISTGLHNILYKIPNNLLIFLFRTSEVHYHLYFL